MQILKRYWKEIILFYVLLLGFTAFQFMGIGDYIFAGPFNKRDGSIFWSLAYGSIFSGFVFFGNAIWLIPRYLSQKKFVQYLLFTLLLLAVCTGLEYVLDELLKSIYHLPENLDNLYDFDHPDMHRRDIGTSAIVANLILLGLSFIYRFTRDWATHEATKRKLINEKLSAELNFLKAQINPHLLFNTLNAIFALARKNKDYDVADALQKLSEIMRYMLYDSGAPQIQLKQEVQLIENLIELQKLRAGENDIIVQFEITGDTGSARIAPLLFIPLVENAFKYGVDPYGASVIVMRLKTDEKGINFTVRNTIFGGESTAMEKNSGIGLANTRRRLVLTYPDRHELKVNNDGKYFEVELQIQNSTNANNK